MKRVDCRKCKKCNGTSCKVYGNNAEIAVLKCADDIFANYEPIRCVECENFFLTSHNKKRKTGKCKIGMRSCEGKGSIICSTYFKRSENNA